MNSHITASGAISSSSSNPQSNESHIHYVIAHLTQRSKSWRFWKKMCLLTPIDMIVSLDLTSLWRRHIVWSRQSCGDDASSNGAVLIDIITARYATTNIFLSLQFSAVVATYFSPTDMVTSVRATLFNYHNRTTSAEITNVNLLEYVTGIVLIVSIIVTGSAILANYTAISVFRAIGKVNASIILRSSIGLYAAQLPSRLTIVSIYLFFAVLVLFWWINFRALLPGLFITAFVFGMIFHVVTTFSALCHIILATGAMGNVPIVPEHIEQQCTPDELSNILLAESFIVQKHHKSRRMARSSKYLNQKYSYNSGTCQRKVTKNAGMRQTIVTSPESATTEPVTVGTGIDEMEIALIGRNNAEEQHASGIGNDDEDVILLYSTLFNLRHPNSSMDRK